MGESEQEKLERYLRTSDRKIMHAAFELATAAQVHRRAEAALEEATKEHDQIVREMRQMEVRTR